MNLRSSSVAWLVCTLVFGQTSTGLADTLFGRVVSVADGDTLTVLDSQQTQHKVRLMGIDAPEKAQAYGQASKASLSRLVFGQSVEVDWKKADQYGRIVGRVRCNGLDINREQVRRGLAWHYKLYEREQAVEDRFSYAGAETGARRAGRGLWADAEPIPPWDWRKNR